MIRPAVEQDAPNLAALQVTAWREKLSAWAPQWFVRSFDPGVQTEKYRARIKNPAETLLVVVDSSDAVEGFIAARPLDGEPSAFDQSIYGFYVHPDLTRRGLGRALLLQLQATLAANGARATLVFTFRDNIPARRCYESCGGVLLPYTESDELADLKLAHVSYGFGLIPMSA